MAWIKGLQIAEGMFPHEASFTLPYKGTCFINSDAYNQEKQAIWGRVLYQGPKYDPNTGERTLSADEAVVSFNTQDGDLAVIKLTDIEFTERTIQE